MYWDMFGEGSQEMTFVYRNSGKGGIGHWTFDCMGLKSGSTRETAIRRSMKIASWLDDLTPNGITRDLSVTLVLRDLMQKSMIELVQKIIQNINSKYALNIAMDLSKIRE